MALKGLKLLVVGVNWPPETFIQRKLRGLADQGLQVMVATTVARGQSVKWPKDIDVVKLPRPSDPAPWQVVRLIQDLARLRSRGGGRWRKLREAVRNSDARSTKERLARFRAFAPLASLRPDIVHFEWNGAAAEYLPLYPVWNCPVVISCRGSQINVKPHQGDPTLAESYRASFRQAAAVHCVSESICREAQQFGLDPTKARIIRPAVDPEMFRPLEPAQGKHTPFRVVTIGQLLWRKVNEYTLLALRRLIDSGIPAQLEIIGDGPERQRIVYTIHDLGLDPCVALRGKLAPDAVKACLQQADAFILTSLSEGISNAVLEAMACGIPVVTTNCGGMPEAVSDGVEGFVTRVRDAQAMGMALTKLATDEALRSRMGQAARSRIIQSFSLNDQIDRWLRLYQEVANSHHARS